MASVGRVGLSLEADYVVVGAGAAGMAFTDALVAHADVQVALVDRRAAAGGHWLSAYPFVRLHQASSFYGVGSQRLGGAVQTEGPEKGLHERASQPEIVDYYARVLARLEATGRVRFYGSSSVEDGAVVSAETGERVEIPAWCRVVDGRYLSPMIPAETPPPFAVDGARVVSVNDLPEVEADVRRYVITGSGKTATDAIVWLLSRGVDPDAICWVRPREPWMLNRAVVQPDPAVFLGMAADVMEAAVAAASLDDLFLRLEAAGVMLRVDRSVLPTMAKAPTLAVWELELLRSVENVVRRGYIVGASARGLTFADGMLELPAGSVVVHCAGDGLRQVPLVPVWQPEVITLQPIRTGFPCFGAALVGYVEATRDDDAEKNRLCPPSPYGNTLADWARMNVLGTRSALSFMTERDIREWANTVAINPTRIPPDYGPSAALDEARGRLAQWTMPGIARLDELSATEAVPLSRHS